MAKTPDARVQKLVGRLVEARLDASKSKAFVELLIHKAADYKESTNPPRVTRTKLLEVTAKLRAAIRAIDNATDRDVHFDPASYLSTYAMRARLRSIRFTSGGHWDGVLSKEWPHIERVPPIDALTAYMEVYADAAKSIGEQIPTARRGRQADFEGYRPILFCAGAWLQTFGTKPGTKTNSPFIRAAAIVLPLFKARQPQNLDVHAKNAFAQAGGIERVMRLR